MNLTRVRPAVRATALILFSSLVLSACAPKNYVVLLAEEDGSIGSLRVSNEEGTRTVREAGTAVAMNDAGKAPGSPWSLTVETIQEVFGSVFAMRAPEHTVYTLYFEFGSTKLTPQSHGAAIALLADVADRPAPDATVEGHTDRFDSEAANEALALLRAFAVEDLLVEAGVPAHRITLSSHGESRPAIETADGVREPLNRRVVVSVR